MKCLICSSHLDDEVLACGGVIAKHVTDGDRVTVCFVASRVYNHKHDPKDMEKEMADCGAAQKVLGYQDSIFLDNPDEWLDIAVVSIVKDLERVVNEIEPDIVYLPWKGDYSQDHRAVFNAAMIVCRPYAPTRPARLLAYETTSSTGWSPSPSLLAFRQH